MKRTPRPSDHNPTHPRVKHYHALQARTNDAMSSVLAKLAGLTHDHKMDVMRAVILYGEAEHARATMAADFKANGLESGTE